MLLHFIYDIPTNMTSYIEWKDASLLASMNSVLEIALAIMFLGPVKIYAQNCLQAPAE